MSATTRHNAQFTHSTRSTGSKRDMPWLNGEPSLLRLCPAQLRDLFDQCLCHTPAGYLLFAEPGHRQCFAHGPGFQAGISIILGKKQRDHLAWRLRGEPWNRAERFFEWSPWISETFGLKLDHGSHCQQIGIGTGYEGEGFRIKKHILHGLKARQMDWTRAPIYSEEHAKHTRANIELSVPLARSHIAVFGLEHPRLWAILTSAYHAVRIWVTHHVCGKWSDLDAICPQAPAARDDWHVQDVLAFVLIPYHPSWNDPGQEFCSHVYQLSHLITPFEATLRNIQVGEIVDPQVLEVVTYMIDQLDKLNHDTSYPTDFDDQGSKHAARVRFLRGAICNAVVGFQQLLDEWMAPIAEKGPISAETKDKHLPLALAKTKTFITELRWISDTDLNPNIPREIPTW